MNHIWNGYETSHVIDVGRHREVIRITWIPGREMTERFQSVDTRVIGTIRIGLNY